MKFILRILSCKFVEIFLWESLIFPSAVGRGLTNHFGNLCGALPMPVVLGLRGTPVLWILGRPLVVGILGVSSSRSRSCSPLLVLFRMISALFFFNLPASIAACHCSDYSKFPRRLVGHPTSWRNHYYSSITVSPPLPAADTTKLVFTFSTSVLRCISKGRKACCEKLPQCSEAQDDVLLETGLSHCLLFFIT